MVYNNFSPGHTLFDNRKERTGVGWDVWGDGVHNGASHIWSAFSGKILDTIDAAGGQIEAWRLIRDYVRVPARTRDEILASMVEAGLIRVFIDHKTRWIARKPI